MSNKVCPFPEQNPPDNGCFDDETSPAWHPPPNRDTRLTYRRNYAIYGVIFQILSCFIGFGLNRIRKSAAHNVFNGVLLAGAAFGGYGVMKLKMWWVFFHVFFNFSMCLIFFIAAFVESFAVGDDPLILALYVTAIPDVFIAYISWKLYYILRKRFLVATGKHQPDPVDYDNDEHMSVANPIPPQNETLAGINYQEGGGGAPTAFLRNDPRANMRAAGEVRMQNPEGLCASCLDNNKDARLHPCGHTDLCTKCAIQYIQDNRVCPICMSEITSYN